MYEEANGKQKISYLVKKIHFNKIWPWPLKFTKKICP